MNFKHPGNAAKLRRELRAHPRPKRGSVADRRLEGLAVVMAAILLKERQSL